MPKALISHVAGRTGIQIIVAALILAAFGGAVPAAEPAPTAIGEEPWIKYDGMTYSMGQRTGVPFDEVKACLGANLGMAEPVRVLVGGGVLTPGSVVAPGWPAAVKLSGVDFYHRQADGVVMFFLEARVAELFEKEFHIRRADFIDPDKFTAATALCAKQGARAAKLYAQMLTNRTDDADAIALMQKAFPLDVNVASYLPGVLKYLRNWDRYYAINATCFPSATRDGVVAPWCADQWNVCIVPREVHQVFEENHARFVDSVDQAMGLRDYLTVHNATDADLPMLRILAGGWILPNGDIDRFKLIRYNAFLTAMGSGLRVDANRRDSRYRLAMKYHLDSDQLPLRRFVPVHLEKSDATFLYVTSEPLKPYGDYPTTGGTFSYDAGCEAFVLPLARKVIDLAQVSPALHLPSAEQLTLVVTHGSFPAFDLFGENAANPFKFK